MKNRVQFLAKSNIFINRFCFDQDLISLFFVFYFLEGPRSPIISGDIIVLRSANTDSTKWLECTNSSCGWTNCQGSANSKGRSSCSKRMMFVINGKKERRAIVSGATVSLSSVSYGSNFLLGCSNSSSTPCGLIT